MSSGVSVPVLSFRTHSSVWTSNTARSSAGCGSRKAASLARPRLSRFAMMSKQPMKANVYVSLKKTVLDPQGETIRSALRGLGFDGVEAVRQGKHFEIRLANGLTVEQARAQVEGIARGVLTNPGVV